MSATQNDFLFGAINHVLFTSCIVPFTYLIKGTGNRKSPLTRHVYILGVSYLKSFGRNCEQFVYRLTYPEVTTDLYYTRAVLNVS